MPATIDEKEAAIATATNSYCLWDFTNRIERSRWGMRDSLFRSRWRSKRRFPISKERTILVAGVETISSLGAFTWIWGEQYKGRNHHTRPRSPLIKRQGGDSIDIRPIASLGIWSHHFDGGNLITSWSCEVFQQDFFDVRFDRKWRSFFPEVRFRFWHTDIWAIASSRPLFLLYITQTPNDERLDAIRSTNWLLIQ